MWHVDPLLGNSSLNRHKVNNCTAREVRCFFRGLCQDIMSRTSEELVSGVRELVGELAR
jgi:hypothetical protein